MEPHDRPYSSFCMSDVYASKNIHYNPAANGRALAQAVSRRLLTAEARVRVRGKLFGMSGGQNGTGAGFFGVLMFPLTYNPVIVPQSSLSSVSVRSGTVGE
jgi:hypothetical protein